MTTDAEKQANYDRLQREIDRLRLQVELQKLLNELSKLSFVVIRCATPE